MTQPTTRMTCEQTNRLALSAIRKIDSLGPIGLSRVTWPEIEALAIVVVANVRLSDLEEKPDGDPSNDQS